MKRTVNIILLLLVTSLIVTSVRDFDNATNGLELFKAIFWLILGGNAFLVFFNGLRWNKWHWEF